MKIWSGIKDWFCNRLLDTIASKTGKLLDRINFEKCFITISVVLIALSVVFFIIDDFYGYKSAYFEYNPNQTEVADNTSELAMESREQNTRIETNVNKPRENDITDNHLFGIYNVIGMLCIVAAWCYILKNEIIIKLHW